MRVAAVEWDALLELIWVAPVAVLAVAITFSLCIHGVARSNDSRRAGNATAATAYGALALVAAIAFAATVIFGVVVITSKD